MPWWRSFTVPPWVETLALVLFGLVVAARAVGACQDFWAALTWPFELDYGEGIVWQQTRLIPGPTMYGNSPDLPFIVFHYPPVYYLLTHAMASLEPNLLVAGRSVAALSSLLVIPSVTALVLLATRQPGASLRRVGGIAVLAGLLVLSLHAVRAWGMLMRVDMPGIALGMAGLAVAAWANGRFVGTTIALLLCVAAVYTKQTQVAAGVAVFLIALLRNPRGALAAAGIAGAVALGALAWMQGLTAGGFLHNIIGYNINRIQVRRAFRALWTERSSLTPMLFMAIGGVALLRSTVPALARGHVRQAVWEVWAIRGASRAQACRALMLLHFAMATVMLATLFKAGGGYNYFLEWLCAGCAILGVWLVDLSRSAAPVRRWFAVSLAALALALGVLPLRSLTGPPDPRQLAVEDALVQRMAAAQKPVWSENMSLLMRAGKPVIFEPSIVTELAYVGRWDERPLVEMIRAHGFAFVVTMDDVVGAGDRRTPAVDAAMRESYPNATNPVSNIWLRLPP